MKEQLVETGSGFWNIRGSFKVGGLMQVGTQASVVQLASGEWVLLDSYGLEGELARQVLDLTDQGHAVSAILNLHPFHTVHVASCAAMFPGAKLYGTARHKARAPELRWEAPTTDSPELHARFAEDLEFSVPAGVDFIPENESFHFASVLAFHGRSGTLHVDDTLSWMDVPLLGGLRFHPTLRFVLQKRPGAVAEFRAWAEALIGLCGRVEHLCTAHGSAPPPPSLKGAALVEEVRKALARVESVLARHARRHG